MAQTTLKERVDAFIAHMQEVHSENWEVVYTTNYCSYAHLQNKKGPRDVYAYQIADLKRLGLKLIVISMRTSFSQDKNNEGLWIQVKV